MRTKSFDNSSGSDFFESKNYQTKSILNKYEYDLFDEDKDVVEKVVRVKRTQLPNKGERWRIIENNKVAFTIEGTKVSKKEKEFLRTLDGFNFLITQFKAGTKTISRLKFELKRLLK